MPGMSKKRSAERNAERNKPMRVFITLFFSIGCLIGLVFLYYSSFPVGFSLVVSLVLLVVSGQAIMKANGLEGAYGVYMLKSKRGLGFIDWLARKGGSFWEGMADWGAVLSFGLMSYLIFDRRIGKKTLILGLAAIAVMVLVILPNMWLILSFLNIPGVNLPKFSGPGFLQLGFSYAILALLVISIFGGVLLFMIALLGFSAFDILYTILSAVSKAVVTGNTSSYANLSSQVPGIAPIIPGLTLPLFSGILALAVVLVVHEFSHGILARVSKIKLKSMGILPFGIIPVGAFVEPDEKQVEKLEKRKQNGIFVAGVSSNFIMTFLFFALTALMIIYAIPVFFKQGVVIAGTVQGYPAYGVIKTGSVINSWNGYPVNSIESVDYAARNFTPYAIVRVSTNKGNYTFDTNATGKIGVLVQQSEIPKSGGALPGVVDFLYSFFVITFVLNFFVGGMNLLPLPAFDGWRVYKNRIKSKKKLHILGWLMIIAIIVLMLPWIWIL
jgi:hypothetical protein